jgi:hypothetical protein
LPRESSGSERRKAPRYACILEARVAGTMIPVGDGWVARVTDISISGVGLHFGQNLPPGAELTLQLHSKEVALPAVQARVVHCTEQSNGSWIMGAAFLTPLADEDLQRLLAS